MDSALAILVPALAVLDPVASLPLLRLTLRISATMLLRPSTVVRAKLAALWTRITLAV